MRTAQLAIAALILTVASASAGTLTWSIAGSTLEGGASLTGSFGFDADTTTFSAISVATTSAGIIAGSTYIAPIAPSATMLKFVTLGSGDLTGLPALWITLESPMTNSGGTINFRIDDLYYHDEGVCSDAVCTSVFQSPGRYVLSGSISAEGSATPEPSMALPIAGAAVFAAFRRRFR